jgi:transposase
MVLWEEYRQAQPEGYGYSRFGDLLREFKRRLSPGKRGARLPDSGEGGFRKSQS